MDASTKRTSHNVAPGQSRDAGWGGIINNPRLSYQCSSTAIEWEKFTIACVFGLYIWSAAADPADPAVFKSKKYLKIPDSKNHVQLKESKLGGESTSSLQDANVTTTNVTTVRNPLDKGTADMDTAAEDYTAENKRNASSHSHHLSCFMALLAVIPCTFLCNCSIPREESSEQQQSEDGMFYCSLCEVEVRRCI
ncbi:hypothetical protein U1Q18_029461 [Sarracenia purpurea var. burkii]